MFSMCENIFAMKIKRITVHAFKVTITAPKAVGILNLFNISKTMTDIHLKQVAVQQQMKEIHFSETKKHVLKCLNAFEPATSHTAQTLFAPNYSETVKSLILN